MKRKLRNITITLEEEVARWARIEAAKIDSSVSRLVASMLRAQMEKDERYEQAMKRALARPAFLKTDGKYMTREEAHERTRLR